MVATEIAETLLSHGLLQSVRAFTTELHSNGYQPTAATYTPVAIVLVVPVDHIQYSDHTIIHYLIL